MPIPDTLAWRIDQFRTSGRLMLTTDEMFRDASWFAVLTGQGGRARDHNPLLDVIGDADNSRQLAAMRQAIRAAAARIPAAD